MNYHHERLRAFCSKCNRNTVHEFTYGIVSAGLPQIELRRFGEEARCTICGKVNTPPQKKTD